MWRPDDPEPVGGHLNPWLCVHFPPPGEDVAVAAERVLRERWYSRR